MRRILAAEVFNDIEIHLNKLIKFYPVKEYLYTRIQAVLLYRKIRNYSTVGIQLEKTHGFVRKWNLRACHELSDWDNRLTDKQKRQHLIEVFSDLPRIRAHKTYTGHKKVYHGAAASSYDECTEEVH